MCFHGLIVRFFLAPNNIPLYSYTTICLSVHLQKNILSCFQYGATTLGFPVGSDSKQSACNAGDQGLIPGSGRSPREGNGYPTPVFLPGKAQGQRTLASYSPWGPRVGHDFHFHRQSYCKHLCAGFVWTGIEPQSPDCRRILYPLSHQESQISINKPDNQLNFKKRNSPFVLSSTK